MTRIEIEFSPDGPVASHLLSATPTRTRGGTVQMQLGFYQDWPGYGDFYGTDGSAEYQALVDQLEFVDPVWTGTTRQGIPFVDEDLPARAPVDSQIFEITPGSDIQDIDSFWGVITGGTDESAPPDGMRRATVEVFFLADGGRYSSRTALKNDLGAVSITGSGSSSTTSTTAFDVTFDAAFE